MTDLITSMIRTYVPMLVALAVVSLGDALGVEVGDTAGIEALSVAVVFSVYYAAARWLEQRWPAAGRLLGRTATPTYEAGS